MTTPPLSAQSALLFFPPLSPPAYRLPPFGTPPFSSIGLRPLSNCFLGGNLEGDKTSPPSGVGPSRFCGVPPPPPESAFLVRSGAPPSGRRTVRPPRPWDVKRLQAFPFGAARSRPRHSGLCGQFISLTKTGIRKLPIGNRSRG